ncbi:MAG: hypothetical protein HC880_08530 [Bacteroidia bacterium]|nr:hypothetical protein [Bacteroidia bacterium]
MLNRNYLERLPDERSYRLGPMAYYLVNHQVQGMDLVNAAKQAMAQLSNEIQESCMLGILRYNTRVTVYEVIAPNELQVINRKQKEAYETATGRILLAALSQRERREYITKYGLPQPGAWEDVQDEEDLYRELDKIQKKELAIQIATQSGILGVAVPIKKGRRSLPVWGFFCPKYALRKINGISLSGKCTKPPNALI